jgi:hypothetical protein
MDESFPQVTPGETGYRDRMAEPHPPVPDSTPMPTKAGRNMGVAAVVLVSVLVALALVVVDTAGGLDGWRRLLYVIPAVTFVGAGLVLLREAATSGRR